MAVPDRQIRWLVTEACGLAWDAACLRIFTTSVERRRRYENHLGPLLDALGPYAPADIKDGAGSERLG